MEEKMKTEFVENADVVKRKAEHLAGMIEKSNHFICFTGAGISTSVGIPDYRSAKGTIIGTGPGQYEKPKEDIKIHHVRKKVQAVRKTHLLTFN